MANLGSEKDASGDDPERETVAAAVTNLLKDGKARTAREIAESLASLPGLTEISKRSVNSVLYDELSREVGRDEMFRWSIAPAAAPATFRQPVSWFPKIPPYNYAV